MEHTLFVLLLFALPFPVRAEEPIDIGSRRELFVDRHLIDRLDGARLALHRPVETDDVFVHDTPWEGNRTLYYTIFQDGDIYRMYYRSSQINLDDDFGRLPQLDRTGVAGVFTQTLAHVLGEEDSLLTVRLVLYQSDSTLSPRAAHLFRLPDTVRLGPR